MSFVWALVIVFIVSYLVGSVNFARIISWQGWKRHITKVGSGNPGTMNILRTYGLGVALFNLLLEVVKSGLTAWLCRYLTMGYGYPDLVFFFSGFAIVLGSCFPCFGFVKGGKGVACAFGVFVFSDLWYVALALFVIGVIQIAITDYGFISSMIFIILAPICQTIFIFVQGVADPWLVTILVWAMCLLVVAKHYKNFYRLFTGQENKANFRKSFLKMIGKKQEEPQPDPEAKEIVIDEEEQNKQEEEK